jgi:tRNA A-37 threonylcarbamoyl transferase component Bud32
MEALLQIPYFADPSILPGPIPSIEEIESSSKIFNKYGAHRTVRVGEHFVVKYGERVNTLEADNMMFIHKQTNIPVPQLYAVFRSPVKPAVLYIVMQYIHGNTLLTEWPTMSEAQKSTVGKKLRSYFAQLRGLPSPGYYGSLGRGHMPSGIFWDGESAYLNPAISGPFETEADLNNGLVLKSRGIDEYNKRRGYKAEFYAKALPVVLRGHHPTFTHGDFQRKNIMVRRKEQKELAGHEDDYEVTLIDWEMSGWYPDYWEYTIAACSFRFDDDWPDKVGDILDPYLVEFPWLINIYTELIS